MKLEFIDLQAHLQKGMEAFSQYHGFALGKGGVTVTVKETGNRKLCIEKRGSHVSFLLDRPYQVFRAAALLLERLEEESFYLEEPVCFATCGAMFDGSQASAIMTVESVKKMLLMLAGMGYNMAMLYCEDTFDLAGEPYWGHMRPRYSQADFREVDDYAHALGIEMIPCIQTLGHLSYPISRYPYNAMSDTSSTLLIGDPRTYDLIDKIICQVSGCFRSRRIHIGLDEAWGLGTGNYLTRHGYTPQTQLMRQHVKRVCEITEKYGLRPMMWDDMFFRAKSANDDYFDTQVTFDDADRAAVPAHMDLIYWDYYHMTTQEYEHYLDAHMSLSPNVVFAGCARNVRTFATHYKKTEITTNAALLACKRKGVRDVFVTVWGDDHRESSTFAVLPGLMLFAEHMYSREPDMAQVRRHLQTCTGVSWDAFMDVDALDAVPEYNGENVDFRSLTRAFIWQDVLLGLCDRDIGTVDYPKHYKALRERFFSHMQAHPSFEKFFRFYYHVADTIELKANMGIGLYEAYRHGDRQKLRELAGYVLPELYERMEQLRSAHRDYFFEEYKPIGWEVMDIRYGGALARLDTAMSRLLDFLEGKISKIEELEEPRLSLSGDGFLLHPINYTDVCSASFVFVK